MKIVKIIRSIQVIAVLIILLGAVCGFLNEVYTMVIARKVDLADLLLLFIYVEVMGMIRVYLLKCRDKNYISFNNCNYSNI